jgi:tetratricopeptide (TPR) repeat protein
LIENDVFYTKTMAKVYEDQGQYEKAARIYRYLLHREPNRKDLSDTLCELEKKCSANSRERLVHLFVQWLDLLITSNELKKLKKLQNHVNNR